LSFLFIRIMETFKDISWYEGLYQVSNLWNVKSLNYRWNWKEQLLKPWINWKWYLSVVLSKLWKSKTHSVHRLVLKAFRGYSNLECNHKNWKKDDNHLENLEYCTSVENQKHKYRVLGYKNPLSKKVKQFTKQWDCIKIWESTREIERKLNIAHQNISECCIWRQKTAWWYIWKFKES